MTLPQKIYLSLLVAENYPEQEPEYIAAKWFHLIWLLIPMIGIIIFPMSVKESYKKNK